MPTPGPSGMLVTCTKDISVAQEGKVFVRKGYRYVHASENRDVIGVALAVSF